jgi:uncharacterized membrane protein YhaH (DUF805 family)
MVFGLKGRLNRKPYWIVSVVMLVLLVGVALGSAVVSQQMMQEAFLSGGSIDTAIAIGIYPILILGALTLYPATAIMVKRFHDLGRTGKWVLLLLVPTLGKMASDMFGITGQELSVAEIGLEMSGEETLLELWKAGIAAELRIRPAEFAVDVFNFIVSLWYFVWLGFFRGTRGANQYGPDPLETAIQA